MSIDLSVASRAQLREACKQANVVTYGTMKELKKRLKDQGSETVSVVVDDEIDDMQNSWSSFGDSGRIFIDVGGFKFVTTKSTLCRYDAAKILVDIGESDEHSKEHFIDRNGKYFNHILDFLRLGEDWKINILVHLDQLAISCIKQEAKYFGLYDAMFAEFDASIRWNVLFYKVVNGIFTKRIDMSPKSPLPSILYSSIIPSNFFNHNRIFFFDVNVCINNDKHDELLDKEECISFGLVKHFDCSINRNDIDAEKDTIAVIGAKYESSYNGDYRFVIDGNNGIFSMCIILKECEESKDQQSSKLCFFDSVAFDLPNADIIKRLRFGCWTKSRKCTNAMSINVIECDVDMSQFGRELV